MRALCDTRARLIRGIAHCVLCGSNCCKNVANIQFRCTVSRWNLGVSSKHDSGLAQHVTQQNYPSLFRCLLLWNQVCLRIFEPAKVGGIGTICQYWSSSFCIAGAHEKVANVLHPQNFVCSINVTPAALTIGVFPFLISPAVDTPLYYFPSNIKNHPAMWALVVTPVLVYLFSRSPIFSLIIFPSFFLCTHAYTHQASLAQLFMPHFRSVFRCVCAC